MCRMCLVEVEGPRGATLQPACFIEAGEGMVVDTTSEKVKKAQDGVLEFLLANHPLDCPVCDKGGECPLQDQTLAYGPGETRFIEEKRHFEKPIAISDLVLLDRERCIQCARCTRFASDVAGEAQIDFAGRGEHVEVATFPTEPFSSYFSGNTVQICPVGALTATPYRFTARPWDLDQVESTCTACSVGLPGRRAVVAEPPDPAARHRLRAGQPRLALRQGPLLLRVGQRRRGRQRPGAADRGGRRGRRRRAGHGVAGRQPRCQPRPVPGRGARDGTLRARPPGGAAHPQGGRAGPGQLGRGPGRRRGRPLRRQERRRRRRGGPHRRGAPDQRVRLRLGQAGQGRHRHRLGRRPAGRRPSRRARAGPAPGHHRRGLRRAGAPHAGRRPARGAAGALPAPARGRGRRRHAAARDRAGPHRADRARPRPRCASARATRRLMARALTGDAGGSTALGTHPEGADRDARTSSRRPAACWPPTPTARASSSWPAGPRTPSRARSRPKRCARWPPRSRRPRFLPALRRGNVFGALDMGLAPGHPAGPGQPRCGTPALHRRLGLGARRHRPLDGRHPRLHGRRARRNPGWPGSRGARAGPARRRPARRLPRPCRGRQGAGRRALRRRRHGPPFRVGRRARRRRAAVRGDARAGGHHDQH